MWSRVLAFFLLLLCGPLLLLLGILIWLGHPGSIFYSQLREGKHGKPFRIWKLRTMVRQADKVLENLIKDDQSIEEEWRLFGCLKRDPRIAGRVAKFLRQTSVDEFPQLWNVCKGEMAFIGPRPLELFLADRLDPNHRKARNTVLPGMTGLWQIGPRSDTNVLQMQRYDLLYIRKRSYSLHFFILWQTLLVLFKRKGL